MQQLKSVHKNDGGLLMISDSTSFGYLMHLPGRGVFDATHGLVDVSAADASKHNELLDEAAINGLDEQCRVGQGFYFYAVEKNGVMQVTTFLGKLISDQVQRLPKRSIKFTRGGRVFKGRLEEDQNAFFCKRIK